MLCTLTDGTLRLQVQVTIGYCMAYVFMQTFAVPGTLSLSLLAGALYGTVSGLLLVSGGTCTNATRALCAHMPLSWLNFSTLNSPSCLSGRHWIPCSPKTKTSTSIRCMCTCSDQHIGRNSMLWHVMAMWQRPGLCYMARQTGSL